MARLGWFRFSSRFRRIPSVVVLWERLRIPEKVGFHTTPAGRTRRCARWERGRFRGGQGRISGGLGAENRKRVWPWRRRRRTARHPARCRKYGRRSGCDPSPPASCRHYDQPRRAAEQPRPLLGTAGIPYKGIACRCISTGSGCRSAAGGRSTAVNQIRLRIRIQGGPGWEDRVAFPRRSLVPAAEERERLEPRGWDPREQGQGTWCGCGPQPRVAPIHQDGFRGRRGRWNHPRGPRPGPGGWCDECGWIGCDECKRWGCCCLCLRWRLPVCSLSPGNSGGDDPGP